MRYAYTMAVLGAIGSIAATSVRSDAAQSPDQRPLVWSCVATVQLEKSVGTVDLTKIYAADGSVLEYRVSHFDRGGDLVRKSAPTDDVSTTLAWSTPEAPWEGTRPFSWDIGDLRVAYHAQPTPAWLRERHGLWHQTVLPRDGQPLAYGDPGERYLQPVGSTLMLATDPAPWTNESALSIDRLLDWAGDRALLRVYETVLPGAIKLDRYRGVRRRIAIEYDIDITALRARIALVRAAAEGWEALLTDWRTRCPSMPAKDPQEIIVTER